MRVGLIFATLATAGILAGCSSSGSSGSLASIDVGGQGPGGSSGGGGTGGGGSGGHGGSGGSGGGSNGAEGSVVAVTRTYDGSIATSTYGQPTGRNATGGVLAFLREETNGTSITGSPQEVAILEGEAGGAIPQEGAGDFSRMEVAPAIGSPARVLQPQGGERTTYVEISSTTGDTNQLSYVDYDYVRAGTAQVLPFGNGVGQETAFYGAKDPSVERPTTMNGTATYVGGLGATVFSGGERNAMTGRTTLNADFDNATITGKVDGIQLTTGNGGGAAGSSYELLMENGSIAGADYNGTVRAVDIGTGATVIDSAAGRSTFNGGFYGPGAEETAGIIDIQGTQGGSAVDIIGAYNGEKQ